MKAKKNHGKLTPAQFKKGRQMAADWKWYEPSEFDSHLKLVEWDDPDYPDGVLIECGNLARIHFRAPSRGSSNRQAHPRRRRDTTVALTTAQAAQSYLAFDPEHAFDRLYMLIAGRARKSLAARFWGENTVRPRPLAEWAMLAGGRHAQGGYPTVIAKPVGVMTAVVYYTDKKDDGPSYYIHRMGEMSCYFPILCCDDRGRLWVCGGNYTSPTPGITD
jgi:hypothetical protein